MTPSDPLTDAGGFREVRVPVDSLRPGDRLRSNDPGQAVREVTTVMTGSGWRCRVSFESGREHFEPGSMVPAWRPPTNFSDEGVRNPFPAPTAPTTQPDQGGQQ